MGWGIARAGSIIALALACARGALGRLHSLHAAGAERGAGADLERSYCRRASAQHRRDVSSCHGRLLDRRGRQDRARHGDFRNAVANWFFDPIISVGFPMPKIAFLPVVILWLGVYDISKITMVGGRSFP
jgi:hypothetical protein